MRDDATARKERAQHRRETWRVEPLTDAPPAAPLDLDARLELLEELRRVGFALAGIEYPEAHGHIRATQDLDVWVRPTSANAARVMATAWRVLQPDPKDARGILRSNGGMARARGAGRRHCRDAGWVPIVIQRV